MNYPVWDISMGTGLLMAFVAIIHVFVSHFAVGGGLFLVLTERKAFKNNNSALRDWLKKHSKFFVLITVVYGAVSGVGIWFTIGLISPSATSMLIHNFVWAWATEWVFFFLEISASLFYLYGWEKLDYKTHQWFGWIYFISAFFSLVIINGIITFMLTSGDWPETLNFWDGYFNPSYWPSLVIRFVFSLALAGVYAYVSAAFARDKDLKSSIIKWASAWVVPAFVILPFVAWWYIGSIPADQWADTMGPMPTATRYATLIAWSAIATFVLALAGYFMSRRVNMTYGLILMLSALATMWSFEFIREAVRKPYVINRFMYANGLMEYPSDTDGGFSVEKIDQNGVLKTAKWLTHQAITPENKLEAGRDIFRVECQSCHTVDSYRSVRQLIKNRGWPDSTINKMLEGLDLMHNSVMPPFTGLPDEQEALAAYLADLAGTHNKPVISSGKDVFHTYCNACHNYKPRDVLFRRLKRIEKEAGIAFLERLPRIFVRMPDLRLTEAERGMLMDWVKDQFNQTQKGE